MSLYIWRYRFHIVLCLLYEPLDKASIYPLLDSAYPSRAPSDVTVKRLPKLMLHPAAKSVDASVSGDVAGIASGDHSARGESRRPSMTSPLLGVDRVRASSDAIDVNPMPTGDPRSHAPWRTVAPTAASSRDSQVARAHVPLLNSAPINAISNSSKTLRQPHSVRILEKVQQSTAPTSSHHSQDSGMYDSAWNSTRTGLMANSSQSSYDEGSRGAVSTGGEHSHQRSRTERADLVKPAPASQRSYGAVWNATQTKAAPKSRHKRHSGRSSDAAKGVVSETQSRPTTRPEGVPTPRRVKDLIKVFEKVNIDGASSI